jgi:TPR repeat protein
MMKNYPGAVLVAVISAAFLFGCQMQRELPTAAQIEVVGMKAIQEADASAERKLMSWSQQNLPVAQRELALLYQNRPQQRNDALRLFEQAARGGDVAAAFELGEMLRVGVVNIAPQPLAAAPWYTQAAQQGHARAALALGLLYKNGLGVERNDLQAAHWLQTASDGGNPHAMFLLSYFYRAGQGVTQDPAKARALLEESAEHEYPPAIQELAMTVELGDAHSAQDLRRASHLLKEATEHRHNNWNRF